MPYTQPTPQEFEIDGNSVTHIPTGAWFTAHPGKPLHQKTLNMLGSVLPDGRDYRESEVWDMAQRLWAAELKRRGYK